MKGSLSWCLLDERVDLCHQSDEFTALLSLSGLQISLLNMIREARSLKKLFSLIGFLRNLHKFSLLPEYSRHWNHSFFLGLKNDNGDFICYKELMYDMQNMERCYHTMVFAEFRGGYTVFCDILMVVRFMIPQ